VKESNYSIIYAHKTAQLFLLEYRNIST